MATIQWATDTSGDFATKANWTGGVVPGSADTADIFHSGYNYFTVSSANGETVSSLFLSNYASLDITGGGISVSKSLTVEGTVTVETTANLVVGATIINQGEIDLAAPAGKISELLVDGPFVSLTGPGVINLAAGGDIFGATASDILFNNSTIAGGGTLGAGFMALVNQSFGVIDGSAGMEVDTSGQIFGNTGLIEATGGGVGLVIASSVLENRYGTIAANGGALGLASAVIEHGTLATSGGGVIVNQDNGVILDGAAYGLANTGSFQFQGTLGMEGTITNTGEFLETSGAATQIRLGANLSLAGSGTLAFNTGGGLNVIYSAPGKSYTLTNASTITGHVGFGNGHLGLTNTAGGVIDAQGAVGGMFVSSNYTVVNAGLMEATGGAGLEFDVGTVNNAGGVILAGAGSQVSLLTSTVIGGAVSIAATGTLFSNGAGGVIDLTGGGTVTNAGWMRAGSNLVIHGGTVLGTGGAMIAAGGATFSLLGVQVLGGGAAANQLETDPTSTIAIGNGSSVQIAGQSDNTGTVALTSTGAFTDLRILAAGAAFVGGGTITLFGPKARILGATATATLTNANNTIVGVGSIGANNMTLDNQAGAVIEATGLLTVRDAAGHTLTNSGLMEANATGKLALVAETINQGGGGTILAATGLVTLQGVDFVGGTLTTTGAGRINVDGGGATLDGTLNTVTNSGLLQVTGAQTLTVDGNVANSGKLDLHAARLLVGMAGVSLTGKGQVNLNDSVSNVIVGTTAAATLSNVDNRIAGSGHLGNGVMTLVNEAGGQIIGNQGVGLTIDTAANTIFNAGLIENSGKGGTLVKSEVSNSGTLAAVTAGTLTLQGAVTGAGVGRINGGTLYVVGAFTENVTFTGTTGVLKLGDSAAYAGQVSGLSKTGTNSLDLADIAFSNTKTKATYSGTTASGTLTVTDGTHTAHIALIGNYLGSTFTVSTDGHTGTKVVDPQAPAAPSASLAQAMAGFQHGPAAHLAATSAYSLPRFPMFHAQA